MSTQGNDLRSPAALAGRLTPVGDEREQLTARHLARARQCCSDILGLAEECAPSTRVLIAYLVLLHDALAVLSVSGWRVAPSASHVDAQVLDVLATTLVNESSLADAVRLVSSTREAELEGCFATEETARTIQTTALDVHGAIELRFSRKSTSRM